MANSVALIGCGAQAKYVIEIINRNERSISNIFDPIGNKVGKSLGNYVVEDYSDFSKFLEQREDNERPNAIICLVENKLKRKIFKEIESRTNIVNAIHPFSPIATTARLGFGIIINPLSTIEPYSQIGNGCMVHSRVMIGHDSVIGNFVSLGPTVTCLGGVSIGDGATIYTGSIISPNVKVGANSIIGASSLVLKDVPSNVLAYGTPARVIRKIKDA